MLSASSGHAEFLKEACAGKQAGNLSSLRRTRKVPVTTKLRPSATAVSPLTCYYRGPELVFPPYT